MKALVILGLVVLLVSGCAASRQDVMRRDYHSLCLAEGKGEAYCKAWSKVKVNEVEYLLETKD